MENKPQLNKAELRLHGQVANISNLRDAIETLNNAFDLADRAMEVAISDCPDSLLELINAEYPFPMSLEDQAENVKVWAASMKNGINNLINRLNLQYANSK